MTKCVCTYTTVETNCNCEQIYRCHPNYWNAVTQLVLGLSGIFVPGYPSGIWTGTQVPGVSGNEITMVSSQLAESHIAESQFA